MSRPNEPITFLQPDWPAPPPVRAAMTLRGGGVSAAPYDSLNVATHVGDDPRAVAENRRRVRESLRLPEEPVWLEQVHGTAVLSLDDTASASGALRADAVVTRCAGRVCAIQVADCMPVLFTSRTAAVIGAAHAGWRGLAGGVLEATVAAMQEPPEQLLAWLGPAIGPGHFEVGDEVRAAFVDRDARAAAAFTRNPRERWQCDLYALARLRLGALGVRHVFGGGWCTRRDSDRFFSFRRENRCGRMVALIWRHPS